MTKKTSFLFIILIIVITVWLYPKSQLAQSTKLIRELHSTLTAYSWLLSNVDNGNIKLPSYYHLVFEKNGKIEGAMGCNSFTGTYLLKRDQITFGPITVNNNKECPVNSDQTTFISLIKNGTISLGPPINDSGYSLVLKNNHTLIFKDDIRPELYPR